MATNDKDADTQVDAYVANPHETITWQYVLTNTGNEDLKDITVNDDKVGAIICPQNTLAINESMTCTTTGVANVVNYSNNATVIAKGNVTGTEVTDTDPSHYKVFSEVDISIEKATNSIDADTQAEAVEIIWGDAVTWRYVVKNTGNEQLENISVLDDTEGVVTCPKTTLDSNESMVCEVKKGIANRASYVNNATVSAKSSISSMNITHSDLSHYRVTTAHIGDYFWIDKNANGIQEADEMPVIGGKVELFDENSQPVTDVHGNHSLTTDSDGKYGFIVKPGTYQVKFTIPDTPAYEGYVFSNQKDDLLNTDVSHKNFTQNVTVIAGEDVPTLDAGINCGCANISTDSVDALSTLSMLMMMQLTLMLGLYFRRKEEV
jgi:uncharacterized repeat protein (TIGR01451 family)